MTSPSRLAQACLLALSLLVVIGLYIADGVQGIPTLLFCAAAIAAWFWPARSESRGTWLAITVLFLIYAVAGALIERTAAAVAESAVQLLLYLMVNKLFHRSTGRDQVQLLLLTLLCLLAVAGVTEELVFAVVFLVYVLLAVTALLAIHLGATRPAPGLRRARIRSGLAAVSLGSALVVLLLAGLTFLLVPRIGLGLFFSGGRLGASLAGFSDRVELGTIGRVRGGSRVIARVEFPGQEDPPDPGRLYLRGAAYSRYDGRTWRIVTRSSTRLKDLRVKKVYDLAEPGPDAELVRQRIYLEPIGVNVMPIADRPLSISFEGPEFRAPRTFYMLFRDREDAVRIWRPDRGSLQYEAVSDLTPLRGARLRNRGRDYPEAVREGNLDIAAVDPRVCDLARSLAGEAADPYDQARALERALEGQYGYTEEDDPGPGDIGPLEHFLLRRKQGHCEYFSSALAMMLRCLGVPTRNATGFAGGEWNEFGGYLAVAERDAHSWTEVYFPGAGWQRFDATPAREFRPAVSMLDRLYDAARLLWFKYVVEYDLNAQVRALRSLGRAFGGGEGAQPGPMELPLGEPLRAHALAILLIAGALVALYLVLRHGGRPGKQKRAELSAVSKLYRYLEQALARRGVRRNPAETPRRFAGRAAEALPGLADVVQEITELHEGALYGGQRIAAERIAGLRARLSRA